MISPNKTIKTYLLTYLASHCKVLKGFKTKACALRLSTQLNVKMGPRHLPRGQKNNSSRLPRYRALKKFCPVNGPRRAEERESESARDEDGDGSADGGGRACTKAKCQHRGREAGDQLVGPRDSVVNPRWASTDPHFAPYPLH